MRTRGNFITERAGVNHVRLAVESAGCYFKEINLQHDVGHDATVMLVVNGQVRPREIALQIKAGSSYVTRESCRIPATAAHIFYWAHHDLITLGVVYDPEESVAHWVDLQTASREHLRTNPKSGKTFSFAKQPWNRLDASQFSAILIPTLLGEAPIVPLETVCDWINYRNLITHDLGVRTFRSRYRDDIAAWRCLLDAYRDRPVDRLSVAAPITISMLLGHDDIGYYQGEIPRDVRREAVRKVLAFGAAEVAKALALISDNDFERPSIGYSMMPLWGMNERSPCLLAEIAEEPHYGKEVQERAAGLLAWYRQDPHWWGFWRRDNRSKNW